MQILSLGSVAFPSLIIQVSSHEYDKSRKFVFVMVGFIDLNLKQPRITLEENVSEELSRSG